MTTSYDRTLAAHGRDREAAEVAGAHNRGGTMPLVNVRVMENVLTHEQKTEIADRITDTLLDVIGEPVRPVTLVIVDDIASGQLTFGGQQITTEVVKEMLGAVPAST
jgi:4-oxalocrotonate tautomerase